MNREEIITGLVERNNITFGTTRATTTSIAAQELNKAKKTAANISNLIERLQTAKDAGIKLSISTCFTNDDYFIHVRDNDDALELVITFGHRLLNMIGSGPDPIKALDVALIQAYKRVDELQQHLAWLHEDVGVEKCDRCHNTLHGITMVAEIQIALYKQGEFDGITTGTPGKMTYCKKCWKEMNNDGT